MKRITLLTASLAMLLAACSSSDKTDSFVLNGSGFPESINGTYALVYDADHQPIDSILVENGQFKYQVAANDTVINTIVVADMPIVFAREAGNYTVAYEVGENNQGSIVRGGDQDGSFVKTQELMNGLKEIDNKYRPLLTEKSEALQAPDADKEQLQKELSDLYDQYEKDYVDLNKKYLSKGGNSLIDLIALSNISRNIEAEEFVEYYEAAGSMIKNDEGLKKLYTIQLAAANTSVGKQFVDYEIVNPAGETKMLSEYREEGKYFLLDFFASWCGPCKRSMPVIAEIEKEFGGKILTSASIAVWERDSDGADYANAVKELKITWPTMQDSKSEGANLYGVSGVPTFILFSPEGEILKRGHDIQEIQNYLRSL